MDRRRRRSLTIRALVVAWFVMQGLAIAGNLRFFREPAPGFAISVDANRAAAMQPATDEARDLVVEHGALFLEAVEGVPVPHDLGSSADFLRAHARTEAGEITHYTLRTIGGERVEASLQSARPSRRFFRYLFPPVYGFFLVGFVYFALGVLIWKRRPDDPGSFPFALLCMVAALQMVIRFGDSTPTRLGSVVSTALFPMYGPAAVYLAASFFGADRGPRIRNAILGVTATALLLSLIHVATGGYRGGTPSPALAAVSGVLLLVCTLGSAILFWMYSRGDQPVAVLRRARFMALASGVSFTFPCLWSIFNGFAPPQWQLVGSAGTLASIALYPVLISWSILRHRLFDMRTVMREALLSVGLFVAFYVAWASLAHHVLIPAFGVPAAAPVFKVAGAVIVALLIALVRSQLARRAQGRALAETSETIARARTHTDIAEAVRVALLEGQELSRAILVGRDEGRFHFHPLGEHAPGTADPAPSEPVPVERFPRLDAILDAGEPATVFDGDALEAQLASPGADFWSRHGIEVVLPIELRGGAGALLLGARRDGRPFTREDWGVLRIIAAPLGLALENAVAFDEIQRLNDGLEAKVEARTEELQAAVDELKATQGQLIETEKQAMLGRLVAGILHEVNTPLGAMSSASDTIRRAFERARAGLEAAGLGQLAEPEARRATKAIDGGVRLTGVLDESTARIEALMRGLQRFVSLDEAELKEVDLREGLDSAILILEPRYGAELEVVRNFAEGERTPRVRCHPARLNQVFMAIMENAADAMEGRGALRVELACEGNGSVRQARIVFADQGPGIPPEKLSTLFDFGFTTKEGGRVGLRLGLPTARRSVEEVGGKLWVDSALGEGTRVHLSLPLAN